MRTAANGREMPIQQTLLVDVDRLDQELSAIDEGGPR